MRGPCPQIFQGNNMSGYKFNYALQDQKNTRSCTTWTTIILTIIVVYNTTIGYMSINYLLSQYFGTSVPALAALVMGFFVGMPASILAALTWVLDRLAEVF